ncbi:hypothetical protein [Nitrosopumilus adriaticus]|uniref:hypothetical protein n=1 Tax=Nitrosopumilus adriaticus TaxID=1580092 RepID=UPI00352FAA82
MKTRFLIIVAIVMVVGAAIALGANLMSENAKQREIKLNQSHLAYDPVPDPLCFVADRATSGETGSGVTMDACFTVKQFEEMGCTKPMLEHLNKHSNILDFESDGAYYLDFIGLPDGMSQEKFERCWDVLIKKRTNLLENTKPELESEITPRYEKYLDENNELNFAQQYDNNGIIIDDLQRIFDWCDYAGEKPTHWYFDWNNSTHHIDSNNCKWELLSTETVSSSYELDGVLCMGGRGYIVNDACERIGKYDPFTGLPIVENKEQCDMLEGTWYEEQKACESKYGRNEN